MQKWPRSSDTSPPLRWHNRSWPKLLPTRPINARHVAHEVAGIQNMLSPDVGGCKTIWQWLTAEANQAWKDTNDVLLSHQLGYDAELTEFIAETERTLQAKRMEIWGCVTCIAKMAHLSPETGLCLTLHIVGSLPTIPVNLCFCSVIPMLLAYCLESYSLQTWDPEGDGDCLLDADTWVCGMLLRKLACIEGGAPMDSHNPHCAPSPAGSEGLEHLFHWEVTSHALA